MMSVVEPTPPEMNSADSMVIDVVIPAAGKGLRLGSTIPKQYLNVNGLPVLAHTLQRLQHLNPRRVVLVVSENDEYWRDVPGTEACEIVRGGDTRANSVLNGLLALHAQHNLSDPGWVLVHDAARPCVKEADVARLVSAVGQHEVGGILGVKIVETVKHVTKQPTNQPLFEDVSGTIHETLDREVLWLAQTPQLFRRAVLIKALTVALSENSPVPSDPLNMISHLVTDEASALEKMGYSPLMVEGSRDNIKVTNAEDLELAAFFLRKQLSVEQGNAGQKGKARPDHGEVSS